MAQRWTEGPHNAKGTDFLKHLGNYRVVSNAKSAYYLNASVGDPV